MEKKLGKIQEVKFGLGGYHNAMLGLHVVLGGSSWAVGQLGTVVQFGTFKP